MASWRSLPRLALVFAVGTRTFAARVKSEEGLHELEEAWDLAESIPPALYSSVKKITERTCDLQHLSMFAKSLPGGRVAEALEEGIDAVKIRKYKSERWHGGLFPVDVDASQLPDYFHGCAVEEDDGLDAESYPSCSPGSAVLDCAKTLGPALWLQQVQSLDDRLETHEHKWFCPWCARRDEEINVTAIQLRRDLFYEAVYKLGFSVESSQEVCVKQAEKPDRTLVRQCMLGLEKKRLLDHPGEFHRVETLANLFWMAEDEHLVQDTLATPEFRPGEPAWWSLEGMQDAWDGLQWKKDMKERLRKLGFHIEVLETNCINQLSSGRQKRSLERTLAEVTGVCRAEDGCSEAGARFCPEGTRCDCQRPWTHDRAAQASDLTSLAVSPITVALVAGTGGWLAGGIAGAIWAAGWFPDYIPAGLAAAAFSRKWSPECMCFEMTCELDVDKGMCVLSATDGMRPSTNPHDGLPSSGVKCARRGSDTSSCELQQCDEADVIQRGGDGTYGKVGYIGMDLYNCANTEGTKASMLGFLDNIPGKNGTMLPNTPATRAKFYNKYWSPFLP